MRAIIVHEEETPIVQWYGSNGSNSEKRRVLPSAYQ